MIEECLFKQHMQHRIPYAGNGRAWLTITSANGLDIPSVGVTDMDVGISGVTVERRGSVVVRRPSTVVNRKRVPGLLGSKSCSLSKSLQVYLKGHCIELKYYADGIHSGLTPPG